ncbi:Adaptive-response sensory-kinase SasA [Sporomusa aerivorans]
MLLYSGITVVSLLGCMLILYLLLSMQLIKEQKEEVIMLAQNETNAHMNWFMQEFHVRNNSRNNFSPSHRSIDVPGNIFYFFVDANGQARNTTEPLEIQQEIYKKASQWEGIYSDIVEISTFNGKNISVAVAAYPVYLDSNFVGTLYAGKNLEAYNSFLSELVHALSISVGLFMIVVAFASHFLASRAIIPIRRSLERQRQFVDDASHELRTPLSIVRSALEIIDKREGDKMSPFSVQLLADIRDEMNRLSRLVGDMLTLARADSGTVEIDKSLFDFCFEAKRVVRKFEQRAQDKAISLTLEVPEQAMIYADRERLVQLLTLLLDNAIKYTPRDGAVHVSLQLTEELVNKMVQLSVKDTGIGINAEDQQKIFERFCRVDQARTRQKGGFGLGLAIAKWIVQAHDGNIAVVSQLGKGSSFQVLFPAGIKSSTLSKSVNFSNWPNRR